MASREVRGALDVVLGGVEVAGPGGDGGQTAMRPQCAQVVDGRPVLGYDLVEQGDRLVVLTLPTERGSEGYEGGGPPPRRAQRFELHGAARGCLGPFEVADHVALPVPQEARCGFDCPDVASSSAPKRW